MSGFLQRLAIRASGQVTPIHSAALTFNSTSAWSASASSLTEPMPLPEAAPVAPEARPAAPMESLLHQEGTQVASRSDLPDANVVPEPAPWSRTKQDRRRVEAKAEAESTSPAFLKVAKHDPTMLLPAKPNTAHLTHGSTAITATPPVAHPPRNHEAARSQAAAPQNRFSAASAAVPEPLLPLTSPPPARLPSSAPPTVAAAQQARPGAPAEHTTEVHVSIGRIEIAAVHEAPAPRRPAAPARQPMSLEDYLAKRQGRP